MNFDFMQSVPLIKPFYYYCSEAEEFALSKPDISVACARKAIEYIVRLLYSAAIQNEANQLTVYDMLCSPDFVIYLDDRTILDAIHFVRRKGNIAVHQGGLSTEDARATLEQLHYVAGEICIFLGLLADYPPFRADLLRDSAQESRNNAFSEDEPSVAEAIINSFSTRLKGVRHYSQLRQLAENPQFIDVHVNTTKYKEVEKSKRINTSSNVRTAFEYLVDWVQKIFPDKSITPDYRLLQFTIPAEDGVRRFAVKMGCTNLGRRAPDGEWVMLPNIDYVFYTYEVDPQKPLPEQFRVFSRDDFLKMWQDLKSIKFHVSSTAHRKLSQILGSDEKLAAEKYADEICVQQIKTSRKKTKLFEDYLDRFPLLTVDSLKETL